MNPWLFRSRLVRVVDGDTYYMEVDFGFRTFAVHPIRLWGLDTPEMRTVEGKAARAYCVRWFEEHSHGASWPFLLETDKDKQTFNRYIGKVTCVEGHSIKDALEQEGFVK